MAPKKGTKPIKLVNNEELYKNLALSDVLCPICRYILILPVTLPCNHNFCSACFQGTVTNANLTCPLCRVRFASWLRIAKKDDKIVNHKLWLELQMQFSEKVLNRQNGIDECLEEVAPIQISNTGDIRKEYELLQVHEELQLQKERQAEEEASKELIKKICEEEAYQQTLLEKKFQNKVVGTGGPSTDYVPKLTNTPKKRPLDKLLHNVKQQVVPKANEMNMDVNSIIKTGLPQTQCSSAKTHCSIADAAMSSTCNESNLGKQFVAKEKETAFKEKSILNYTEVIEITDSNDSIENECKYFKPIDHRNVPPSNAVAPVKVPAVFSKLVTSKMESPASCGIEIQAGGISAFARYVPLSRKRKMKEHARLKMIKRLSLIDPERLYTSLKSRKDALGPCTSDKKLPHTMTLRDRKPSNSSPTPAMPLVSNVISGNFKVSVQPEALSKEEIEKLRLVRLEQEKTDLEFAKKLQEEFNRERYTTRSSISCRNNLKKSRQLSIAEIMSTSKCK